MSYTFQVTVDCTDPHTLAHWWAKTLGWTVEPSDEDLIRSLISQGFAAQEDATMYQGILVWADGCAISLPDGPGGTPRILFQRVPEAKTVKNRMHLDVSLGEDDPAIVRAALEARGATFLYRATQGPHQWDTMADIEGNEFCIAP